VLAARAPRTARGRRRLPVGTDSQRASYLAAEILLLPQAARGLVAGVLGALHGLYFHLFVQTTGYSPALVLVGAALVEAAAVALPALMLSRVGRMAKALRPVQVAAFAQLALERTYPLSPISFAFHQVFLQEVGIDFQSEARSHWNFQLSVAHFGRSRS
jgi:hypothetical protein